MVVREPKQRTGAGLILKYFTKDPCSKWDFLSSLHVRHTPARPNIWSCIPSVMIPTIELDQKLLKRFITKESHDTIIERYSRNYQKALESLKYVKQILSVVNADMYSIWTVIEAPPFNDRYRDPIYNAQLNVLQQVGDDISIDFHILNTSELCEDIQTEDIVPHGAKIIWQQ